MKILYVDQPIEPPGGGQFSLLVLLKELTNSRKIKVFIPSQSFFSRILVDNGIDFEVVPANKLYMAIKKEKPAIVHCNSATTRYSFFCAFYCKLLGIPFIWHVRVVEKSFIKDDIIAFLSSKIIAVSQSVKNKFHKIWHNKICVIYNAVSNSAFKIKIPKEKLKKSLMLDKDEKIIGIFSRLVKSKGHGIFIEAAYLLSKDFPNLKFLVCGSGEELENIKKMAESLSIEQKIIFTGHIDNISDYMNICDIVVSPSIEPESFGRVVIEAMSLGKVVVASNLGGHKEIIENMQDGVLIEPTASHLYYAISQIIKNDRLISKISFNAREKVALKFSIARHKSLIEDLYIEMSNKQGKSLFCG